MSVLSHFTRIVLLPCFVASTAAVAAQNPRATSGTAEVVVHVEPNIDLASLQIQYVLTDGGRTADGEIRGRRGVRDFPVGTLIDGRPAQRMRGHAYLPGYGYGLFASNLTAGDAAHILVVELARLPTVRLSGRIVMPAIPAAAPHQAEGLPLAASLAVVVSYVPTWQCEHFARTQCVVDSQPLATVVATESGEFATDVPDFSHDPSLALFRGKGEIELKAIRVGAPLMSGRMGRRVPVAPAFEPVTLDLEASNR